MFNQAVARTKIKRASATHLWEAEDALAVEEPLEIKLEFGSKAGTVCKTISVTMRTPGHDEELALGFLWTEGILQHRRQIVRTSRCFSGNEVVVRFQENEATQLHKAERNFYAASGCGVCGKVSKEAIRTVPVYKDIADAICLPPSLFYNLEEKLRKQQAVFQSTGGLHAAALFDLDGNFLSLREDVGRHNALDKLIGAAFLKESLPLNKHILLLSGRAGFELVQKAAMAGIRIVAAVGAPSSLAVQLAQESGMTLIGFLRNKGFNIYSGEQRIMSDE